MASLGSKLLPGDATALGGRRVTGLSPRGGPLFLITSLGLDLFRRREFFDGGGGVA